MQKNIMLSRNKNKTKQCFPEKPNIYFSSSLLVNIDAASEAETTPVN